MILKPKPGNGRRLTAFGRRATGALLAAMCLAAMLFVSSPPASAHAELRQSSPAAGETVGGPIHAITLQMFDLDVTKPQTASIFNEAGEELAGQVNRENQRLVIALIDPITTPGDYMVTYAVNGLDGDFSEESFSFTWEQGAPEPSGITLGIAAPAGFDVVNFVLLVLGAAFAAFLVQRFALALREHRAAQR